MQRPLFLKILSALENQYLYFKQAKKAAGKIGLTGLQKITASMRHLSYGASADQVDKYLQLSEKTSLRSLHQFWEGIIELYGPTYLLYPNKNNIEHLMNMGEKRGFPGMLGSVDCMHWVWKNCPCAWEGQHKGKEKFYCKIYGSGMPGSHNGLNVLNHSPLFDQILTGNAPPCRYTINGSNYEMEYYLADGIYPDWATLLKTISQPQGAKRQYFAQMQDQK
ncbi:hypothetical protein O181_018649 [Austropuccinia psidii MF-1]|uniref:Uncharacterized protein n=1 Tax=Austropuccinia psidii MF-1 TaxID=1389203 RepID=A0A9Q3C5N0_9BASI|nr:hypothetical protein [Austropuccinia psidii MF-1]